MNSNIKQPEFLFLLYYFIFLMLGQSAKLLGVLVFSYKMETSSFISLVIVSNKGNEPVSSKFRFRDINGV